MRNLNHYILICLPSQLLKNYPTWHCFSSGQEANSPHVITVLHLLFWPEHLCLPLISQGHPHGQHLTLAPCPSLRIYAFPVKFNSITKAVLLGLNSCLPLCMSTCLNHTVEMSGMVGSLSSIIYMYILKPIPGLRRDSTIRIHIYIYIHRHIGI